MIGHIVDMTATFGLPCLVREVDPTHGMFEGHDVTPTDVLGVAVERDEENAHEWFLSIHAMEFVRNGSLHRDIHAAVDQRIGSLKGVRETWPEDTGTWLVVGNPDPVQLLTTAAELVDEFGPRVIRAILEFDAGGGAAPTDEPAEDVHAIAVLDDSWRCSCGAGGTGNWAEVVRGARAHDKATKFL